jgi:hypothetical protein
VVIGIFPAAVVDNTTLSGSLILEAVQIAVLFAIGWLLRRKPTMNESGMLVGAILLT